MSYTAMSLIILDYFLELKSYKKILYFSFPIRSIENNI